MLNAWHAVDWQPPDNDSDVCYGWMHHNTVVTGVEEERTFGESVWILPTDNGTVGVAMEWFEWQPGVVALRDPMALLSNVEITRGCWAHLPRTLAINYLVNAIPWHGPALEAVRRERRTLLPQHHRPMQIAHTPAYQAAA